MPTFLLNVSEVFADLADDEDTVMVSDDFVVFPQLNFRELRSDPDGRLDRRGTPTRRMAYPGEGVPLYWRVKLILVVSKSIWGI